MARGFFNIIRPLNCLITFIAIIVSGLICMKNNHISTNLFLAGLVGFLITAAGNSINDIIDIDIDRINRPNRPLPSLKLTLKQAWVLFVLLLTASLVLSLFLNQFAFLIVLLSNALINFIFFHYQKSPAIRKYCNIISYSLCVYFWRNGS